jgi:UDP-glucose 4-epimerase
MKMKINHKVAVVTGGAGFIGSHMVDYLLKKNFKVNVLDNLSGGRVENIKQHLNNKKFKFQKLDICKLKPNHKFFKSCNYVFHFAGKGDIVPSIEKPADYLDTNIMGTVKVLEASKNAPIKKFIYAASSSCYGVAKTPTNESHPINPLYPYALSKYLGEKICFHWHKLYKLPVNSIRIFNAYGPRVKTTGAYGAVFGVFFKQKLERKPFTVVGNGNQKRDFVFVTDVVDAFFRASQTQISGQIFNLGTGKPNSVNSLVRILGGKKIYLPKRPGEPNSTCANPKKIKKILNWKPKVKFEDGVKIMLKDIKKWKSAPLWTVNRIEKATKSWFSHMKNNK